MNLDDSLRTTLQDDRWALPVPSDALERVRRGRARRRTRTAVLAGATCLAVVAAGVVVGVVVVGSRPDGGARLGTFATDGGSAVPGISPAWTPATGRDWLLTPAQEQEFYRTHTRPSPGPGQSTVASPAPLTAASAALLADVEAAGLPVGTRFSREDSVGGQPGALAVHATLPNGVPVEILRSGLDGPTAYGLGPEAGDITAEVVDVPDTDAAAILITPAAYGFPAGTPGDADGAGQAAVGVVTRAGTNTYWVAPAAVTLDQLRTWAFAAARHATPDPVETHANG